MKRIVLIPIPAVALLLLALDLFTPEKGPDNLDFGGVISDVFTHYQKTKTDKSSQNAVIKEKETSQYTGAQYERSDLIKPRGSVGEPREAHRRTSNALDETSPPTQIGEYFRLYGEYPPSKCLSKYLPSKCLSKYLPSKHLPSKYLPSKYLLSKHLPSEHLPSKHLPSKCLPSKYLPSLPAALHLSPTLADSIRRSVLTHISDLNLRN
jgi:hypothetical protein